MCASTVIYTQATATSKSWSLHGLLASLLLLLEKGHREVIPLSVRGWAGFCYSGQERCVHVHNYQYTQDFLGKVPASVHCRSCPSLLPSSSCLPDISWLSACPPQQLLFLLPAALTVEAEQALTTSSDEQ